MPRSVGKEYFVAPLKDKPAARSVRSHGGDLIAHNFGGIQVSKLLSDDIVPLGGLTGGDGDSRVGVSELKTVDCPGDGDPEFGGDFLILADGTSIREGAQGPCQPEGGLKMNTDSLY